MFDVYMLISFLAVYSFISFFFYSFRAPRDLHSFPTRRSSDLPTSCDPAPIPRAAAHWDAWRIRPAQHPRHKPTSPPDGTRTRSEEHTSELQSRQYLVCRLLLEKKNKKYTTNTSQRTTTK